MVILGGGVIGASAAFHLAEAGVDVALLERAELAERLDVAARPAACAPSSLTR